MLIKPETNTNSPAASACGNCGVEERRLLHHVRHRGIFRRLCTTCVLRLHPQSFCPTCFQVYPPFASNDAVLACHKCYSSAHSHCVAAGPTSTPTPYICPLCVNPNTPIFKLKTAKEANVDIGEGMNLKSDECRVMDRDAAKKFLAAAKIASASMNKAAVAAKSESERRAKEAAFARKRAKEALEHVAYLVMKERLRKNETVVPGSVVRGGIGVSQVKSENNVNSKSSNRNGIVASSGSPPVVVEEKINAVETMDRVANSNQVLAALNAVELRENEKLGGITAQCAKSGVPSNADSSKMDEDEKGRMRASAGENTGGFVAEKNDGCHVLIADMESRAEAVNIQGKTEEANNGVALVIPVSDKIHNKKNSNGGEQHTNGDQI